MTRAAAHPVEVITTRSDAHTDQGVSVGVRAGEQALRDQFSRLVREHLTLEDRVAEAHRASVPPIAFPGVESSGGPLADGARLIEIDDPAVVVSAIEPWPAGGVVVRAVNLSGASRTVRVRHRGSDLGRLERVDLRGEPTPDAPVAAADDAELALRPWQIAAFRLV